MTVQASLAALPAIDISDLSAGYGRRPVITDVNLSVIAGSKVAVVGPNGAGKSTLFKALVGLLPVSAGQVSIGGRPASESLGRIAYVPQREDVDWRFPISVLDVVLMGRYGRLGWIRRPGASDRSIAQRSLEALGMGAFADRTIGDLSGGQQQRVFLARALAQEPDILLLDEPFGGIDAPTQQSMLDLLDRLNADGITILVSTHDLPLATSRFDYLILLNHRLVAFGRPGDIVNSKNLGATFGSQVLFYQSPDGTLAIADHCCPADESDMAAHTHSVDSGPEL